MSTVESQPELHIIREPKVYLVGRQVVDEEALAAFLDDHEVERWSTDTDVAGEKIIETAGRVCYMSFAKPRPGGNRSYLHHILEVGHGSVLEHAVFNLLITGVSRSLTHELIRHRAGFGYSQLSQRFVDESEAEFVEPEAVAEDPELHAIWLEAVQASQNAYRELADRLAEKFKGLGDRTLRRKKAREAARSVLPNATETKIFVTGNARATPPLHRNARRRRGGRRDPASGHCRSRAPPARGSQPLRRLLAHRFARGRPRRDDAASEGVSDCDDLRHKLAPHRPLWGPYRRPGAQRGGLELRGVDRTGIGGWRRLAAGNRRRDRPVVRVATIARPSPGLANFRRGTRGEGARAVVSSEGSDHH